MAASNEFGKRAEHFTTGFLISKGYHILERNWRYGHLELDVVCTDWKELVFVEVKARRESIFPHPEDVFTPMKERYMLLAAEAYIMQHNFKMGARFDLVAIVMNQKGFEIEHFEQVFVPGVE
ncbi:YraN family protein [Bacteroidota bacterium]